MRLASEAPVKKPYDAPKLSIYGDLTEMTLSMKVGGMAETVGAKKKT